MAISTFLLRHMAARRKKIFLYFIGIIGVYCVVYTLFPNHLYVDKEKLDVDRNGTYAVLVRNHTYSRESNSSEAKSTSKQTPEDLDTGLKEIKGPNQKYNPSADINGLLLKNSNTNEQLYKFIFSTQYIEKTFTKCNRTHVKAPCRKLFDNDANALNETSLHFLPRERNKIKNDTYLEMTRDCDKFISSRGYLMSSFTEMEQNFPLAFSIIAYKQVEQIERLLRAIYRPQNHYCIHMDLTSEQEETVAVKAIASCFPNVRMASRAIDVQWGKFSVLEAELICMNDMWNKTWRYFINLSGQEFPLKTNLELVKILTAMKGANLVDGTRIRAQTYYSHRWPKAHGAPPHNIRPIKGSVHVAVNRDFLDFALHDKRSKDFLQWLNGTIIPDETFFSSLNHNPHLQIPGSFLGEPEEYPRKPTFTRYKNWEVGYGVWVKSCLGKYVRGVCILGIGDLPTLADDIGLFANKFFLDYQYIAYECLEELIFNRTRDQYLQQLPIDVSYYEALDQVRFQFVKKT